MFLGNAQKRWPARFLRLPKARRDRVVMVEKLHGSEAAIELLQLYSAAGYVK